MQNQYRTKCPLVKTLQIFSRTPESSGCVALAEADERAKKFARALPAGELEQHARVSYVIFPSILSPLMTAS